MALTNSRQSYGWIAIGLHWISAVGVVVLYLTGEGGDEAEGARQAAEGAANPQHVSIGLLLFTFLAARIIWSLTQQRPAPIETRRILQIAANGVQRMFLVVIAVQLLTGPLAVWADGEPLRVFGWAAFPSPIGRMEWLAEAAEEVHGAAATTLWALLGLHVLGALKHLVIDRDGTVRRMLWASE